MTILKERNSNTTRCSSSSFNRLLDIICENLCGESANNLPIICQGYGLKDGSVTEAFKSKFNYVYSRVTHLSSEEIIAIANKMQNKYPVEAFDSILATIRNNDDDLNTKSRFKDITSLNKTEKNRKMASKLTGAELIQLKKIVIGEFNESNWMELGAITNTLEQVENHPRLLRSLNWRDDDYDGLALTFLRKMIGPNDENLAIIQDYIAKTCLTIGENVSSEVNEGRKIIFSPNIFQIPDKSVDSNLISVMMPFSSDLSPVYEAIRGASTNSGFSCKRADDIWDHSTIIQDVFSLIFQSHIVVCDFTDKNPNVFYEAGIAHTLGKHVVPITQSAYDIPFDLKHLRFIQYLNNGEGRDLLIKQLTSKFNTLAEKRSLSSQW